MRGRLASRAHSFKENFLNVFGGHQQHQQNNQVQHEASSSSSTTAPAPVLDQLDKPTDKLAMSKKTNSTDNIIDFVTSSTNTIADPRSTEVMVREVHLALRYFQDAVVKGTFELLPGCASVVLETILALQSYAMSRRDPRKKGSNWGVGSSEGRKNLDDSRASGKITASTKAMCTAVAKLTQWADRVITDGCVDPTEDYVNQIIDPVRQSVNALASNLLAISVVPKSTSFHNSLPDLASPERETPPKAVKEKSDNAQSMSYIDAKSSKHHHHHHHHHHRPPPLPPKSKSQSQSDDSMDPVITDINAHVDWFSNPLFDTAADCSRGKVSHRHSRQAKHTVAKKRSSRTFSEGSSTCSASEVKANVSGDSLMLPDFCQPQHMSVCPQNNVSYIDVSPLDFDSPAHAKGPLATSSPRMDTSFTGPSKSGSLDHNHPAADNTSSSTSSDIPPALPRKNRHHSNMSPGAGQGRKSSTYDNVFLPPQSFASMAVGSLSTFQSACSRMQSNSVGEPPGSGLVTTIPPPLPPKKKHIMSYMEMFGRSLVTTDEEMVQSLTRTKDLLEAVWQQNYHDFSYNSINYQSDLSSMKHARNYNEFSQFSGMGVRPVMRTSVSSYQLPPPELPPPPPPPLLIAAQASSGMPPPFPTLPDDEDDNQGDLDDDDEPTTDDIYPPALPPKRGPLSSRSWMSTQGQPLSYEDRYIPIMVESKSKSSQSHGESASSSSAVTADQPLQASSKAKTDRGSGYHRFSDSMTSSTSSSGFGTDIHSMRHSLPSPVMESSQDTALGLLSEISEVFSIEFFDVSFSAKRARKAQSAPVKVNLLSIQTFLSKACA